MRKKLVLLTGEVSRRWIDRLHDTGVDTLGIHPGGGVNAARLLDETLLILRTDSYRELLDYAAERGIAIEYEIHAGSWLVPREMFASHPEYFRENADGQRTPDRNFCVSNPEALKIAAERAADLVGQLYRSSPNYYFWLDDVKDGGCHCEKCRALSESDQQLRVMNAIAKRLRQDQPEAKIAYLAYFGAFTPPQTVVPEEGVFLEYAPIERDMKKGAQEVPEKERDNLQALLDFFGKKDAWVLEYWYDNSLFSGWRKPPVIFRPDNDLIRADVQYYNGLGFDNISSFACYLDRDYEERYGEPDISGFAAC